MVHFSPFLPEEVHFGPFRSANRTLAIPEPKSHNRNIASDFRVDGAKSPEIPQKEGVLGSEIAARNRKSLATFHRTLKSQCSIALPCLENCCDFWVGHRNRKSQKSLRFRCAKQVIQDREEKGASNPTRWAIFRPENVKEQRERKKKNYDRKSQREERRRNIETWETPSFLVGVFHAHFWL